MAAIAGTLAVPWTAPVLVALLAPSESPIQLRLDFDARVLAFLVAVLIFTTIACGIVPALRASRADIHSAMKRASAQAAFVNVWQSRFLVGIQMALSLVLLITSALFVRTLLNLKTLDPGFDRDNIVWAYVHFRATATDEQLTLAWQDVLRRFKAIPGVKSASASIGGPLLAARRAGEIRVANVPEDNSLPPSWFIPVSVDFFRTFGRSLVKGRDFVARDFERSAGLVHSARG
jgi:ABC-type lipoprotein release transport system permease subunit